MTGLKTREDAFPRQKQELTLCEIHNADWKKKAKNQPRFGPFQGTQASRMEEVQTGRVVGSRSGEAGEKRQVAGEMEVTSGHSWYWLARPPQRNTRVDRAQRMEMYFLRALEAGGSRLKYQQDWLLRRPLSLACGGLPLPVSSHGLSSVRLHLRCCIGLKPTHMTLLNLNYLFKSPPFKYRHTQYFGV